jgi:hypothetical protein
MAKMVTPCVNVIRRGGHEVRRAEFMGAVPAKIMSSAKKQKTRNRVGFVVQKAAATKGTLRRPV